MFISISFLVLRGIYILEVDVFVSLVCFYWFLFLFMVCLLFACCVFIQPKAFLRYHCCMFSEAVFICYK